MIKKKQEWASGCHATVMEKIETAYFRLRHGERSEAILSNMVNLLNEMASLRSP
jgi:hypothetical protein